MRRRLEAWRRERLPLDAVADAIRHKTVPVHRHSFAYYLGGMTLFLFGMQVGTGALLLLYYRPSASEAYESVQFIMTRVPFGWLIRSIHSWSANLMVAAAVAHMFSVLFLHAYRRPRELTWISGMLLLALTLGFGFTGYLLPWNELAYFATRVGTDIMAVVPVAGDFLVRFIRGGPDVTGATLTRLFGMHVAILPMIATLLVGVHLYLVQAHGISVPPRIEADAERRGTRIRSWPFVPHFVLREAFGWTLALALLAALSAFYPWELGVKADPFKPAPAGIRPEWYFLWMFQALKYVPAHVLGIEGEVLALGAIGACFVVAFTVPLWATTERSRRLARWGGVAALILMGLLTLAATASAQERVADRPEQFSDSVHAAAGIECASCHKAQAAGAYRAIPRGSVPALCASCHSDAAYMRKFDPQVRVDQMTQYLTSAHGRAIAKGETRAAVCTDCHQSHGVVRVRDARSPVAPLNAARTCAQCHADSALMKAFGHPATVFAEWSSSVHADALLKRGDTSAPTCNTCHGSHGATPPGITEVASVCAQCHVREAENFAAGPKKAIFDAMGQAECLVCHGNHAIKPPSAAMIGVTEPAVCATCHDASGGGASTIKAFRDGLDGLTGAITSAQVVVGRAEHAGMLVEDAHLALQDAREQFIQSRVAIHTFTDEPFRKIAATGTDAARRAERVGSGALEELQMRRRGLAAATLLIVGFLITLWIKIRRLPPPNN